MRLSRISAILFCLFSVSFTVAESKLNVNELFTDNMVLQRGARNAIWGNAAEKCTVKITCNRIKVATIADSTGKWKVNLPQLAVGGPYSIQVIANKDTVKISNVLVGDVWFCAGQSNMEYGVAGVPDSTKEIASANYPRIRILTVPKALSQTPVDTIKDTAVGKWQVCSPSTIRDFSAVAYFFGKEVHLKTEIPIGLIASAWGGSVAEAWTPREALLADTLLSPIVKRYDSASSVYTQALQEFKVKRAVYDSLRRIPVDPITDSGNKGEALGWADPAMSEFLWPQVEIPGPLEKKGLELDGAVWYRKTISIPSTWTNQVCTLSLGIADDMDETYVNGVKIGQTGKETPQFWLVKRTYKIPPELVQRGTMTIAVRVFDHKGFGGLVDSSKYLYVKCANDSQIIELSGTWKFMVEQANHTRKLMDPPVKPTEPLTRGTPGAIYNGMVHPILPFSIKGVCWYQGESNVDRAFQYRTLLPTLINQWRIKWNNPDLPFVIVQLPNFDKILEFPNESNWAELRESQNYTAQKVKNVYTAVTIDLGETKNIHPANKVDVGKRAAKVGLARVYKIGVGTAYTGPTLVNWKIQQNAIVCTFSSVGSGLIAKGGKLQGFTIAGEDRKFVWADARIIGSNVVVSHKTITKPVAVRYAWADNPITANLYNREGYPASPFRTDNWPLITSDKF